MHISAYSLAVSIHSNVRTYNQNPGHHVPVQIAWYYVNEPNAPKTTTPSNISHWLLIWINLKSVGGRGVCVGGRGGMACIQDK